MKITYPATRTGQLLSIAAATLLVSSAYAQETSLPVIPGAKAQGPAPACGSLDYQPCRAANSIDQMMRLVSPKIVP